MKEPSVFQESSPAEGKRRGEEEEALSAGEEESAGEVRAPLQIQHLLRCSTCSKTFSRPGSLRAHQRSHQAQTLHACSICSRGFRKPCLLRKHMRSHVREGLMAEPADKVRLPAQTPPSAALRPEEFVCFRASGST